MCRLTALTARHYPRHYPSPKGRQGKPCPRGAFRSESENDSSGWLRRVRPAVSVQGRESEVRILVHKTSVLSTQRQVVRQGIVGADYALTHHLSLRAEYRGFVYKNPDFGLAALHTDSWTHTAQPSAGIVFRF